MKFFAQYTNMVLPVIFEAETWNDGLWIAKGKERNDIKLINLGIKLGY